MVAKTAKVRVPKRPSRKVLAEVVRRVVEACQPESIVLFGSAARGEMTEHSDLDLLVIKGGKYDYWRVTDAIRRSLSGINFAVDVVLATPETIERYRDSWCLVYSTIPRCERAGRFMAMPTGLCRSEMGRLNPYGGSPAS